MMNMLTTQEKTPKHEETNNQPQLFSNNNNMDAQAGAINGRSVEDGNNEKKQKKSGRRGYGSGVSSGSCQAEKCMVDLSESKRYHRRHKVCEFHAKAPSVVVCGLKQRFCQQCSRFHELSEFDETKRSCRRRLAGHNERRREASSEPSGEGGSTSNRAQVEANPPCRPPDQMNSTSYSITSSPPTYISLSDKPVSTCSLSSVTLLTYHNSTCIS